MINGKRPVRKALGTRAANLAMSAHIMRGENTGSTQKGHCDPRPAAGRPAPAYEGIGVGGVSARRRAAAPAAIRRHARTPTRPHVTAPHREAAGYDMPG